MNRRSFLSFLGKASAAAASVAAMPGQVFGDAPIPLPRTFACNDYLAQRLWQKRMAIDAIQGTYLERFVGKSGRIDEALIEISTKNPPHLP